MFRVWLRHQEPRWLVCALFAFGVWLEVNAPYRKPQARPKNRELPAAAAVKGSDSKAQELHAHNSNGLVD